MLGGSARTTSALVEELLRVNGFVEVRSLPTSEAALSQLVVGRRSA